LVSVAVKSTWKWPCAVSGGTMMNVPTRVVASYEKLPPLMKLEVMLSLVSRGSSSSTKTEQSTD
jgi:hypothetical protein